MESEKIKEALRILRQGRCIAKVSKAFHGNRSRHPLTLPFKSSKTSCSAAAIYSSKSLPFSSWFTFDPWYPLWLWAAPSAARALVSTPWWQGFIGFMFLVQSLYIFLQRVQSVSCQAQDCICSRVQEERSGDPVLARECLTHWHHETSLPGMSRLDLAGRLDFQRVMCCGIRIEPASESSKPKTMLGQQQRCWLQKVDIVQQNSRLIGLDWDAVSTSLGCCHKESRGSGYKEKTR